MMMMLNKLLVVQGFSCSSTTTTTTSAFVFGARRRWGCLKWGGVVVDCSTITSSCTCSSSSESRFSSSSSVSSLSSLSSSSLIGDGSVVPEEEEEEAAEDHHHRYRNLLSVEDCIERYHNNGHTTKFLDGTWYHKGKPRNAGRTEFENGPRIPNSVYFDLEDIACQKELFPDMNPLGLRAMLPPSWLFEKALEAFGIHPNDDIIIYGRNGCHFLPRIWFMFRKYYGHAPGSVHIMNGSLEQWIEQGGPVDTNPTETTVFAKDLVGSSGNSKVEVQSSSSSPSAVTIGLEDMTDAVTSNNNAEEDNNNNPIVIIDSRGSSYAGKGHMPNAVHIPYKSLMATDGMDTLRWKSREELMKLFGDAGVDLKSAGNNNDHQNIICTCGTGVSACSIFLALEELLAFDDGDDEEVSTTATSNIRMYDGSWQEWSQQDDNIAPKVLPPPKSSSPKL